MKIEFIVNIFRKWLVRIAIRASKSQFFRNLFFYLPLKHRISIRRLVVPQNNKTHVQKKAFEHVIQTIHTGISTSRINDEASLTWDFTNPLPQIGNAILKGLETANFDAKITIDFWDTIFGRIRPAEGGKRLTALRYSFFEWSTSGFHGMRKPASAFHEMRLDSEARQVRNRGEATGLISIQGMDSPGKIQNELGQRLLNLEVQDEKEFTKPISAVVELRQLKNKPLEVISDFYLSGNDLAAIANGRAGELDIKEIHSSSDYGLTKRDAGKLFREVKPINDRGWLHIGDSPHSDREMALKHGAQVIEVVRTDLTSWNINELDLSSMADDMQKHFQTNAAGKFLLDVAFIGYGLVTFAIENAIKLRKNKVIYVSREGHTLNQIHNIVTKQLTKLELPVVGSVYLPCSRASLFFPSFGSNITSAFETLALQYPVITREAFIESLSLPEDLAFKVRNCLSPYQRIRTSRVWERIPLDLRDEILIYLEDQKVLIERLLSQEGIELNESVICDLGWRGTINDSLSRIAESEIPGFYLGLHEPLRRRPIFTNKAGLLFDEIRDLPAPDYMDLLGPLERAFTLQHSSVSRYGIKREQVVAEINQSEDPPTKEREEFTEANMVNAVEAATKALLSCGLFGHETAEFVSRLVQNWMQKPNSYHASTWFDEIHAEGFGVADEIHYSNQKPTPEWFGHEGMSHIRIAVNRSLWPEGYLKWKPIASLWEHGDDKNAQ